MALARDFHCRCNGHAPTLTLIQDTEGNVFGGLGPAEYDSISDFKADPSLKSFVFMLNNPHNFPARKVSLTAEEKDRAIHCHPWVGPCFGCGIWVSDDCNANGGSWSCLGGAYANDT
jgi:hypothetical protein